MHRCRRSASLWNARRNGRFTLPSFPDRIVHHLYYNYTHELYEATFIRDSFSCIKNRGTLDGVLRLQEHIRKESQNWTRECYVLKLDIRGYFMHINRRKLLGICLDTLSKMATHKMPKHLRHGSVVTWEQALDMDFVRWLTEKIVMLNPRDNCIICGSETDWIGLDPAKSMRWLEEGLGLPIGNLTSQLFSNVYLNVLDQFMKRLLKCRHYGRYVDDFFVVSCDREWLLSLVPRIRSFLKSELGLDLHMGKVRICRASQGVEFLGAYVKPFRIYTSNATLERIRQNLSEMDFTDREAVCRTVNSYLGIMSKTASYNLRRRLFFRQEFLRIGSFDNRMTKFTLHGHRTRRLHRHQQHYL